MAFAGQGSSTGTFGFNGGSGGGGGGGNLSGTLTATRVPFALDANTLEDDANLVFIKATDRLGVGQPTPLAPIHADSNGANTQAILILENNLGLISYFITNATPEASITASVGSLAMDITDGILYFKTSGAGNTGWSSQVVGSGVSGRVAFWNGLTSQTSDGAFLWDNTNKRLGIGNTPAVTLHADSNAANTVAILRLENSLGDFDQFISNATPEGVITGNIGDVCTDIVNNAEYVKTTTGGNTGWVLRFGRIANNTALGNVSGVSNFPTPVPLRDIFDATQQSYTYNIGLINEWLDATIFNQTNTVTVANSTTESTILGTGVGTKSLYTNYFIVGKKLKGNIKGTIGTDAVSAPTLRIRIKLGATTILDSTAQALQIVSGGLFELDFDLVCITAGVSGTMKGFCRFKYQDNSSANEIVFDAFSAVPLNTTSALAIDATVQFGTADADNTIVSQLSTIRKEA